MDNRIIEFLSNNKICALSVLLPDGSIHSAVLHYSHSDKPLTLYFSTENTSRKCQGLLSGNTTQASVVMGFNEESWITFQLDGEIRLVTNDLEKVQQIHYSKHPGSAKYKDEPETVFLTFTPKWWRYTDYNTDPYTIISSED